MPGTLLLDIHALLSSCKVCGSGPNVLSSAAPSIEHSASAMADEDIDLGLESESLCTSLASREPNASVAKSDLTTNKGAIVPLDGGSGQIPPRAQSAKSGGRKRRPSPSRGSNASGRSMAQWDVYAEDLHHSNVSGRAGRRLGAGQLDQEA